MSARKHLLISLGVVLWVFTAILAILPSWPHIYYRLSPTASGALASTIASTAIQAQSAITESPPASAPPTPTPTPPLPDVDPALPEENGLLIDKIGVKGEIHEGEDWENILKTGIWRVPDFGSPIDTSKPTILAAHRWGYLEWSASFRKLNSFYSLPSLKIGDKFRLIWDQRPFDYEIYSTGTGTEITDYGADVILYTCQLWNSPVRFFVYANRVN